jgi:hypothetical protein
VAPEAAIFGAGVAAVAVAGVGVGVLAEAVNGTPLPNNGPSYVDPKGNVIPTPEGGSISCSPDGRFVQARGPDGEPTGVRIDGPHNPAGHPDPRAQGSHAHVPGVTNPDGTPWLPVN